VLGYQLTYTGYSPVDHEKFAFHVDVEHEGKTGRVSPIMYQSSFTQGMMRNPDIMNLVTKDFYVAPLALEEGGGNSSRTVTLHKGEEASFGKITVRFLDFDFPDMEKAAMLEGRDVRIGATVEVKQEGRASETLVPAKIYSSGKETAQPARYGNDYEIRMVNMVPDREDPSRSTVELSFLDLRSSEGAGAGTDQEILVVEASIKPYINLVWNGVIVMIVGFLVTIVRRAQEARLRASKG